MVTSCSSPTEAKLTAADEPVRGIKPRNGNEKRERVSVNLEMLED
jgi:hypothetical protein